MTTRLVTILGIGNRDLSDRYHRVTYSFQGAVSGNTALADAAIKELIGVSSAVAVSTTKAHEVWCGEDKKFEVMTGLPLMVRLIEDGGDDATPWATFQAFQSLLTHEAIPEAGEIAAPSDIVLNVTHGFRSLPILAVAAATFATSEARRLRVAAPRIRVLYGAYDPERPKGVPTPLWDLTDVLSAASWNGAIDAMLRFGRGDDLAELCKTQSASERTSRVDPSLPLLTRSDLDRRAGAARKLGDASKALADDLALGRLESVLTKSGKALAGNLTDREISPLLDRLPVLQGAVAQLLAWSQELRASELMSIDGVKAGLRLSSLLGTLERFAEQAALLRELQVTLYHLASGGEALLEPKIQGFDAQRKVLDAAWGFISATGRASELGRRAGRLAQIRNDIEHMGLNEQWRSAHALREALKGVQLEMEELVTDQGLEGLRAELRTFAEQTSVNEKQASGPHPRLADSLMPLPLAPVLDESLATAIAAFEVAPKDSERSCYEERIFSHSAARLLAESAHEPDCDLLIVPVGTQPYAPLLAALATRARWVALLHTDDTVREDGALSPGSRVYAERVARSLQGLPASERPAVELFGIGDGIAGTDVLRAFEAAQFWAGDPWPSRVTVDLTGGRKATSAALGALATVKGCRQSYLEARAFLRGYPHGEKRHSLSDLAGLAMADERSAATALLEAGSYAAALVRFDRVLETLRVGDAAGWLRDLTALLCASPGLPSVLERRELANDIHDDGIVEALLAPHENAAALVDGFLDALRREGLWH
jgi:CRISPR-associated DxTHG motif protein